MALVFCDGFDHYLAADITRKWSGYIYATCVAYVAPDYARPPGGMGLQLQEANGWRGIYKILPATVSTFISGFNIKFPYLGMTNPFWCVYDSAAGAPYNTVQLELRLDGAGHLRISRNGTTLATSTNAFMTGVWYHIEIKATIHNSNGAYEVRVNGTSTGWIPSATSQNTRGQSSNDYIDIVSFQTAVQTTLAPIYDDFYFLDTTGSTANDFIGPQKIVTLHPRGAGNSTQFTGNYADNHVNVGELAGDSDWTANQSSTAGHIDLFDMEDLPSGTISGLQTVVQARQDAGSARTFRSKVRVNGTNYNGTSRNLSGGHVYLTDPFTLNPDDSAAWETADVNGSEFGYELET